MKMLQATLAGLLLLIIGCAKGPIAGDAEMTFESIQVVDDAETWWAYNVADIDQDGIQDLVYIQNNANGGYLAWRPGTTEPGMWTEVVIASAPPNGGTFASGDMDTGDIDGDGDVDILGIKHTGEWDDAGEPAEIFWYENADWVPHPIGSVPGAVKDLSLADFNADGLLDLAVLTYAQANLRVFRQDADGTFALVVDRSEPGLHEGMDTGDLDGDGDTDIAANGYAFLNPGGDLAAEWGLETIDAKWHDQTGDWSRNGTKHACADLDGDGTDEVFISHSERAGFPVSWYEARGDGTWTEHVILPEAAACHTLQIADMDLDGDLDVVAGVNGGRAVNIDVDVFPIWVVLNNGDHQGWTPVEIRTDGIYNGRVADFESDGDPDLFRLPQHQSEDLHVLVNQVVP
jgi:hypothetical protein